MCGILGFCGQEEVDTEMAVESVRNLGIRGRDGYGLWAIGNGIRRRKTTQSVWDADGSELVQKLGLSNTILANTRAIPTSEFEQGAGSDVTNQQPFENDEWVVVHNGLIANDKELIVKHKLKPVSSVDSAILPDLFSQLGIEAGLKEIDGSFAIVAYNKITDDFYFGSNFAPLHYALDSTYGLWVLSLKEMFPVSLRERVREVPPYTLMRFERGDEAPTVVSLWKEKPQKNVLVICSGGIDSVTSAFLYKKAGYKVSLLHFTYGQAAESIELYSVQAMGKVLDAEVNVFDARHLFEPFKHVSKLLNQKEADPTERMKDQEYTVSYVPNRNMMFASVAAAIAEMQGISKVALGAQQMDGGAYPDNNPTFIDALDKTLKFSLNQQVNVKFEAPLVHLMKHEVIELGIALGVPFKYVTSCYYPKKNDAGVITNCGACGCCAFRTNAFKMLGYQDPQETPNLPSGYWDGCRYLGDFASTPKFKHVLHEVERILGQKVSL